MEAPRVCQVKGQAVECGLFDDFLGSEETYSRCEEYWRDLVARAEIAVGQPGEWPAWIEPSLADGSRLLDGNPISSGKSAKQERGFRVILERPDPTATSQLTAWIETRDAPIYQGTIFPREEVVIWMQPESGTVETKEFIRTDFSADEKA